MKIVNRATFLAMEPNTVYSKYTSMGMVDGLYQKHDTWGNDWIYQALLDEADVKSSAERVELFVAAECGKEFELDYDCSSRDGLFKDEQMFMVYDDKDITKLVSKLNSLIKVVK